MFLVLFLQLPLVPLLLAPVVLQLPNQSHVILNQLLPIALNRPELLLQRSHNLAGALRLLLVPPSEYAL